MIDPRSLKCAVCDFDNRPGAVACEDCGGILPIYLECAICGFYNPDDAIFCGSCGSRSSDFRLPTTGPGREGPGSSLELSHLQTGAVLSLPLRDGVLAIGRPGGEPDIDLSGFPDAAIVSRRHARLTICGGVAAIEDVGSANGTYLNNVRLANPQPLREGDCLSFGQGRKVAFSVRYK
ncbi:MAG: FHA domain-containing protein [Cyanobacteria bacterium REEB65]|nr:FHA domain-containing protein [Cyanobacteria bacterium REEB65]